MKILTILTAFEGMFLKGTIWLSQEGQRVLHDLNKQKNNFKTSAKPILAPTSM